MIYDSRDSKLKSFPKGTITSESKHIRKVTREDGSRAIGALTQHGLFKLTAKSFDSYYNGWMIYQLPGDGMVYLMEEVV